MAITQVGTTQIGAVGNGGDVTLTFDGSPAENDVVVLVGGLSENSGGANDAGPSTAGYTTNATYEDANLDIGVWYKVLGATPDSSVTGQGDGHPFNVSVYASMVFRGVDTTTPIDATTTESGPSTDGGAFDGPSITTVTNGAVVISFGFDAKSTVTISGGPSGYSGFAGANGVDTNRAALGVAYKEVTTAGAENPGAFSDTGSTANRYEMTIALRPAGVGGGLGIPIAMHHYKQLAAMNG